MVEIPDIQPTKHPAPYSPEILQVMHAWIRMEAFWLDKRIDKVRVLDPMAGIGRVHSLPGRTFGIEIEHEWANQHPRTQVGNALALPFRKNSFDIICVSPAYANRMADSFKAQDKSKRIGYHFALGRKPSEGSSATMQWDTPYRNFHVNAWSEAARVLRPGGLFILNVSDHIRNRERQPVSAFHASVLTDVCKMTCFARRDVPTRRMRFGQNHEARVECEHVLAFRKT